MGKKEKKKECFSENEQEFIEYFKNHSMVRGDIEFFCNESLHKALGLENPDEPEYVYIVDYWDEDFVEVLTETFSLEEEVLKFLGSLNESDILCVQRAVIDKHYEVQIKKEIKLIDAEE